ncbi:MAG: hypothetical protein IJZ36_00735 [Bacilli bacterium]|nr:hypothetical protein [Bacilli bacterium]
MGIPQIPQKRTNQEDEILLRLKNLHSIYNLAIIAHNLYASNKEIMVSTELEVNSTLQKGLFSPELVDCKDRTVADYVKAFERTWKGFKVYHVIADEHTVNLLYVSTKEDRWDIERIENFAFVIHLDSEKEDGFKQISIVGNIDILERIYDA